VMVEAEGEYAHRSWFYVSQKYLLQSKENRDKDKGQCATDCALPSSKMRR
jgi:hypothetical protein